MALRSFLYALVFCAAGFAFITAARPALVYSVLVDDAWTIYVQDNLSADDPYDANQDER